MPSIRSSWSWRCPKGPTWMRTRTPFGGWRDRVPVAVGGAGVTEEVGANLGARILTGDPVDVGRSLSLPLTPPRLEHDGRVQTFLPYPDFERTAEVLDDRRLGKQRVEVLQILNAMHWTSGGMGQPSGDEDVARLRAGARRVRPRGHRRVDPEGSGRHRPREDPAAPPRRAGTDAGGARGVGHEDLHVPTDRPRGRSPHYGSSPCPRGSPVRLAGVIDLELLREDRAAGRVDDRVAARPRRSFR